MRRDDFTDRGALIHAARVYLAQSRHFTERHRGFSFLLLDWSGRCRSRALGESRAQAERSRAPYAQICTRRPAQVDQRQMDFFGCEA